MITIILPTKNEPRVHHLVKEIRSVINRIKIPYEIIAIDDSEDDTFQRLERAGAIVIKQTSKGLGGALIEGLKNAQGDFSITMDADFSHKPEYIPKLLKKCEAGFDIVIGSRREPGGKIIGWNLNRKIVSFIANFVGKHIAGVKVSDVTSGFRLYRKKVVDNLDFDKIKSKGYAFQLEVLAKAKQKGFHIGSIPIQFYNRESGISKLSKKESFSFFLTALKIRFSDI
ncbi:polyprenol monophosphomannose synthase [Candidatus Pacearchaeota archaeon]|nr:polyprenol monophosphomannose synthase [Candidatus Pacearchaeota archaeon]